ncbi:hypothetical protein V5E38_14145 [Rossellomorea sp. GAMAL-10_SWC]
MGISIIIIFMFLFSLFSLVIGLIRKQTYMIMISSIILLISLGLGAFLIVLIGRM